MSQNQLANKQSLFTKKYDSVMLILTFVLIITGLIMMYSASTPLSIRDYGHPYFYIKQQAIYAGIGIVAMFFASNFKYQWYMKFAWLIYFVSIGLLAFVHFFGVTRNNAKRWLDIGVFQFQPSEVAKIAIIILFATLAVREQRYIATLKDGLIKYLFLIGGVAVFTLFQPHLSATIIIAGTGIIVIFIGGANILQLLFLGGAGVAGVFAYASFFPHAQARLDVWLDPFSDFLNSGWQGSQSLMAIGSGGIFGLGFAQSKQKHLYLPEPANDFIFSVICEELGFIGGMFVTILFLLFILRAFTIALGAKDRFGMLVAAGIATKFAMQTIINIFVVTGVFPITGAALPFFSYGGTALIIQIAEVGILLNISKQSRVNR